MCHVTVKYFYILLSLLLYGNPKTFFICYWHQLWHSSFERCLRLSFDANQVEVFKERVGNQITT